MSSWTRPTTGLQRGDLEMRVSELEKLVAELVKVIKISAGGVSIETQGGIWIKGPMSVSIESAGGISMKASSSLTVKGSLVNIQGALVDIQGAPVRLNGGSQPVARTGDMTSPSPAPGAPSIIGPGCPTVLA